MISPSGLIHATYPSYIIKIIVNVPPPFLLFFFHSLNALVLRKRFLPLPRIHNSNYLQITEMTAQIFRAWSEYRLYRKTRILAFSWWHFMRDSLYLWVDGSRTLISAQAASFMQTFMSADRIIVHRNDVFTLALANIWRAEVCAILAIDV